MHCLQKRSKNATKWSEPGAQECTILVKQCGISFYLFWQLLAKYDVNAHWPFNRDSQPKILNCSMTAGTEMFSCQFSYSMPAVSLHIIIVCIYLVYTEKKKEVEECKAECSIFHRPKKCCVVRQKSWNWFNFCFGATCCHPARQCIAKSHTCKPVWSLSPPVTNFTIKSELRCNVDKMYGQTVWLTQFFLNVWFSKEHSPFSVFQSVSDVQQCYLWLAPLHSPLFPDGTCSPQQWLLNLKRKGQRYVGKWISKKKIQHNGKCLERKHTFVNSLLRLLFREQEE